MPEDIEKEEKPKKAYLIKVIVWEDGEIDADIREYRKIGSGRGAPTLCGPLSSTDLEKGLKNYGLNVDGIKDTIATELGINTDTKENDPLIEERN